MATGLALGHDAALVALWAAYLPRGCLRPAFAALAPPPPPSPWAIAHACPQCADGCHHSIVLARSSLLKHHRAHINALHRALAGARGTTLITTFCFPQPSILSLLPSHSYLSTFSCLICFSLNANLYLISATNGLSASSYPLTGRQAHLIGYGRAAAGVMTQQRYHP